MTKHMIDTATTDGGNPAVKLWDRKRVNALKKTAYVSEKAGLVMLEKNAGAADGAQAARELVPGAGFSHLKYGCPVYTKSTKEH